MSLDRRVGLGFELGVDSTGGSSFVNLAYIVDGMSGDSTAKMADISLLSELWDVFAKSSIDGGTLNCTVAYDPAETTNQTLSTLLAQVTPVPNWKITFPDVGNGVASETFLAHVQSLGREIQKDKFVTRKMVLKITGTPGFTV